VKNSVSRRDFLRAGALTAAGATLAACAAQPAAPAAPAPAEEKTEATAVPEAPAQEAAPAGATNLRLSVWADVQDADVYTKLTNAFMEKNPDIKVAIEQYAGGYYEKIQANFAGGDSADMLYFQGWMWLPYAESQVIAPLDEFVNADSMQAKWPDSQGYKYMTEWKGGKYMSPTDTGPLVVYYNKDLFDKKGVEYPKEGWTWEDYQDIVQKLSFEEDGTKYYGWAQAAGWNGGYGRSIHFMRRNGYIEWDQIIEPKTAKWAADDVVSGLDFTIQQAVANEWSPSPEVIQGGGVGVDTGRCAMVLEGPWFMPRCWGELSTLAKETGGINYDVIHPPYGSDKKNNAFAHVHGHCMASSSPNKAAAWTLLKFILDTEGQTFIANGGRMPGHPDNIDSLWAPIATEKYNFTNSKAFSDGMREGSTPMVLGEGGEFNAYGGGPLQVLWDKLLGNTTPTEQAVNEANVELQASLDKYWAERAS
jgi:multiple sugar transport system substrate-binding protein